MWSHCVMSKWQNLCVKEVHTICVSGCGKFGLCRQVESANGFVSSLRSFDWNSMKNWRHLIWRMKNFGWHRIRTEKSQFLCSHFLTTAVYIKRNVSFHFVSKVPFQSASKSKNKISGRDPLCGGYGWRFMFERLWVWIPGLYTRCTLFTLICCTYKCINCISRFKRLI